MKLEGGDLLVAGLRQRRPRVMQDGRAIAAEYRVKSDKHVQVAIADYDRARELTVDPVLEFSTYLGGPGHDSMPKMAIDSAGSLYLVGSTQSPATPGLNPFQQSNLVTLAPFVLKLSPAADRVTYLAVIDSKGYSGGNDLALDSTGAVAVTGITFSSSFPLKNATQSELKASFYTGFVTKLSSDARSLIYSTYLRGSGLSDAPNVVRTDPQGNAYVFGETSSHDLLLKNPFKPPMQEEKAIAF